MNEKHRWSDNRLMRWKEYNVLEYVQWGHGANAVGDSHSWNTYTCDNCHRYRRSHTDPPSHFEFRMLCGRCVEERA